MAERRNTPKQPKSFAASAAIFLTAALFSLPALASGSNPMPCPKAEQPDLNVSPDELVTATVSHDISYIAPDRDSLARQNEIVNPKSLLAPRAEAAIREAFQDGEATTDRAATALVKPVVTQPMAGTEAESDDTVEDARIETPSGMTTRLPGVSDDELSRFKKQMFRRDI